MVWVPIATVNKGYTNSQGRQIIITGRRSRGRPQKYGTVEWPRR